jgi:hypothetical protein
MKYNMVLRNKNRLKSIANQKRLVGHSSSSFSVGPGGPSGLIRFLSRLKMALQIVKCLVCPSPSHGTICTVSPPLSLHWYGGHVHLMAFGPRSGENVFKMLQAGDKEQQHVGVAKI